MEKIFLLIETQHHYDRVVAVTSDKKTAVTWGETPVEGLFTYSYQEMVVYGELPLPPP